MSDALSPTPTAFGPDGSRPDSLFTPEADWQHLPARYVNARRVGSLTANAILTLIVTAPLWFFLGPVWGGTALAAGLAWTAWRVIRAGRWVRSFRYAEREHDLLISHGLWFKQFTAIPYGRMLSVNVQSGPIDRAWGLAGVQLVTASPESNANLPGLPQATAAELRDRLIATGQAQALPL